MTSPPSASTGTSRYEMYGEYSGVGLSGGHIVVYAGTPGGREAWHPEAWHEVWRSAGTYTKIIGTPHYLDDWAVGEDSVALAFAPGLLYVAPLGGREHLVSRHEYPIGWTRRGELLTSSWHHGATILLRSPSGRLIRRVARGIRTYEFDQATGTFVYLSPSGRLVGTDGRRSVVLADVRALGFSTRSQRERPGISLLDGGLISLTGPDRLVILRRDGSSFARAVFPRARRQRLGVAAWSGPIADPRGRAVAFLVARTGGLYGHDAVYVLRAGDSRAIRLSGGWPYLGGCDQWAGLSWHGRWVLYTATGNVVAAIDTTGRKPPIDLTSLARHVPGAKRDGETVAWAISGEALWLAAASAVMSSIPSVS